jgi:hypothetical protein
MLFSLQNHNILIPPWLEGGRKEKSTAAARKPFKEILLSYYL